MHRLLAFDRPLWSPLYVLFSLLALGSQHAYAAVATVASGRSLKTDVMFWFFPLRTLMDGQPGSAVVGIPVILLSVSVLATLSFRRAAMARDGFGWAALSIAPILQVVAIFVLALPTPAKAKEEPLRPFAALPWVAEVQGVLIGVGMMVFAVVVSTLVFGAYGIGLFLASPLLIGVTTGYLANRATLLTPGQTNARVFSAGVIGSLMLMVIGLEGAVCLLLAIPITGVVAIVGGLIGREFIAAGRRRAKPTVMSLAVLPMIFAVEAATPAQIDLATSDAVVINASSDDVWQALIGMEDIAAPAPLLFRLGLAYPVGADLKGEGVGAVRVGRFSTGIARERVTAWEPKRRLTFVLLTMPPAMRELSPHGVVRAPHAEGYFKTEQTTFDLQPLADGRTRLTVRADHVLKLDPAPYWTPLTRWAIDQNTHRVLLHIKAQAERAG
jgi:hypothetical protein